MTVRRLKEMIADLPDDARIFADDGSRLFEGNSEFVSLCHCKQYPNRIVLQTKNDFDVQTELEARLEHYAEEEWDEYDAFLDLAEDGYTLDDFTYDPDRYEWAMEFSETHSWYDVVDDLLS